MFANKCLLLIKFRKKEAKHMKLQICNASISKNKVGLLKGGFANEKEN